MNIMIIQRLVDPWTSYQVSRTENPKEESESPIHFLLKIPINEKFEVGT